MILVTTIMAQSSRAGLIETVILSEDFSKFTAGSEDAPDGTRLDDIETTKIDDAYFNTPGWSGIEIYQAGGCAYIGFSNDWGEPGLISTPLINTEGAIYIKCRMKSESPEGELVGYNIVDETYNAIDANVDFVEITQEWTEVKWFTTLGCEDSYIYIYSYSTNVFIDDIEITSCSMPTPIVLDESDITKNAFTANWESVEDIDTYIFKLFVDHTAPAEETFYYTDTDFSDVDSKGTIDSPETIEGWEETVNGWHLYMPVLIDEAIGVTGRYSSIEQFGTLTSPVSDFSSDKGDVNLSFKACGNLNDKLEINLITPANGYYDIASSKTINIEKEGWNEYSVTLAKGMQDSYIEITYFGLGDIFFDDLRLYQNISEGETKTLTLINAETQDTSYRVNVEEKYLDDVIYYQVASSKFVYGQDGVKEIGAIDSEFSEKRIVTLGDDTPQETETIAIGEDEINSYYAPISNYGNSANFSISQQIYTKEEINKESGAITSISFHNNFGNANTRDIVVLMTNTEQFAYRDGYDWVLVEASQIVYDDEFTFGAQGEWSTIELQKPFAYEGDNIAITIYDASNTPMGTSGYDSFFASATDTLRGLYKTSADKINVYTLGELYGYDLKTSIYTTPSNQYYVNNIKMTFGDASIVPEETTISNPKNIAAVPESKSSIRISWTNVTGATSYNVYRGAEKIANVTETEYMDQNLKDNTEYCYTVTALNGDLESDKSEEVCTKTLESNISISENETRFDIYPSLVSDKLFITTNVKVDEVSIYNIAGVMIYNEQLTIDNLQLSIDVADYNSGMYIIKANTDNGEIIRRFVKK